MSAATAVASIVAVPSRRLSPSIRPGYGCRLSEARRWLPCLCAAFCRSSYTYWFKWDNAVGGNYSLCFYLGSTARRPRGRRQDVLHGGRGHRAAVRHDRLSGPDLSGISDGHKYRVCASQKLNNVEGVYSCMAPGKTPL